jgi:hypothetical protein
MTPKGFLWCGEGDLFSCSPLKIVSYARREDLKVPKAPETPIQVTPPVTRGFGGPTIYPQRRPNLSAKLALGSRLGAGGR